MSDKNPITEEELQEALEVAFDLLVSNGVRDEVAALILQDDRMEKLRVAHNYLLDHNAGRLVQLEKENEKLLEELRPLRRLSARWETILGRRSRLRDLGNQAEQEFTRLQSEVRQLRQEVKRTKKPQACSNCRNKAKRKRRQKRGNK